MANFGVVVIGLGRAGQARVRDLQSCHLYAEVFSDLNGVFLKGFVSRRSCPIEGVTQFSSLEEALANEDVKAVIISTENKTHDELARQSLSAGKHVLVEFPISLSTGTHSELAALAKEKGVHYCEEDIALLTDDYKLLAAHAKDRSLKNGSMLLEGSLNPWQQNWEESGSPYLSSTSLLHTFLATFGDLTPIEASVVREEGRQEAHAKLNTKDGGCINMSIRRLASEKPFRNKKYEYSFTDGSVFEQTPSSYTPPEPPHKPGLFMKDFINFMGHIRSGVEKVPSPWVTSRAIQLAEELYNMAKSKL